MFREGDTGGVTLKEEERMAQVQLKWRNNLDLFS